MSIPSKGLIGAYNSSKQHLMRLHVRIVSGTLEEGFGCILNVLSAGFRYMFDSLFWEIGDAIGKVSGGGVDVNNTKINLHNTAKTSLRHIGGWGG